MSDFCLRFPDESTAFAAAQALDAVAMTEDGPRLIRFTHRYAIDVVGEITRPTGVTHELEGGAIYVEEEIIPGWHVNLRIIDGSDLPADLQQYVVTPTNPVRVWA